ncbi:hypothetical protein F7734_46215 [Scytonema sp. UIC 10036]|uniref:hypothetical protein n=1 Tax=Scytonema sp. UIC 10036 TaxID=2304196 RepID=UPI0012DAEA90|nr:hypothetical protein [Scytonema sp. UIC 10036]MUG99293.1 hypothetical protein [Scytonema sp. UIC 10036]
MSTLRTAELLHSANNLNIRFSENIQKLDVSLVKQAKVEIISKDWGNVVIDARNINIFGQRAIYAGMRVRSSAVSSTSQDVILNSTATVKVNQNS